MSHFWQFSCFYDEACVWMILFVSDLSQEAIWKATGIKSTHSEENGRYSYRSMCRMLAVWKHLCATFEQFVKIISLLSRGVGGPSSMSAGGKTQGWRTVSHCRQLATVHTHTHYPHVCTCTYMQCYPWDDFVDQAELLRQSTRGC